MTLGVRELGPIVNFAAAAVGSAVGLLARRVPQQIQTTVLQALGGAAALIGLSMALTKPDFLVMIVSLAFGAACGQALRIEERLEAAAAGLQKRVGGSRLVEGFVLATLVWCVGALGVLGAIQSGLTGQNTILFAKSVLDGTSGLFFAAALGPGVLLATVPLLLYEGLIALLAQAVHPLLGAAEIAPLTYVGGLLIVLIGTNMLGATKVRVANLLPAIVIAMALGALRSHFGITL